jgi:hypothetical protein
MRLKPDEYKNNLVSCLKATGIDKIKANCLKATVKDKSRKSLAVHFSELTKVK